MSEKMTLAITETYVVETDCFVNLTMKPKYGSTNLHYRKQSSESLDMISE